MQLGEQTRLQKILEELEGAYGQNPVQPPAKPTSGQSLPNGMSEVSKEASAEQTPAPDPRMALILQELEAAYPSNYQMLKPGAFAASEEEKSGLSEFLKGVGMGAVQDLNTIASGISQGLAFIPDMAIKLSQRAATKWYQDEYERIRQARPPGYVTMTPQQEMAAKFKMFDKLGPLDAYVNKWVSDKNLTVKLRNLLLTNAQNLANAGIPVTENKLMEVLRGTLSGIGEAAAVIPVYAAGGPAGLATIGAIKGIAEKGTLEGAVLGGVEGAMLQTMIHAIGLLPSKVQLPTWFGMGAAITQGDVQDRVVGGLTWTALGVTGKKGEVAIKEFIDRYPRWQKRVDDNAATKVLQTLAPDITPEIIAANGGGKAMLDRMVGLKDKFAAVMEVFKKSGNDPKALEAMLNSPEMVPLFRDLMGVTETPPPALPQARPETVAAGSPARFQVTREGEVTGTKFPEDQLLKIQYREQELGRRMTPDELATFFEAQKQTTAPKSATAPKEAAKPKEPEKPAAPAKSDMEVQMMTADEAAKADVDDFKRWANPRFRISYDPTSESDMAAYKDLVKALGLRGDATILEDVSRRLKVPDKKPEEPPASTTPQAPPAPPAPAPTAPEPAPAPPATAKPKAEAKPSTPRAAAGTSKRNQLKRPPTDTPLLTWIRRQGGIALDNSGEKLKKGELGSLYDSKKWRRLFRKKGGVNIYTLQEMAREDGRIADDLENTFWDAIYDEASGKGKHYSDAERAYFGDDVGKPPERDAESYRSEAAGLELQTWLNGRDVSPDLAKDVEALVAKDENTEVLRRQRAENLKRNELLDRMEKDGLLSKDEIEEFLDDTFYDGEKARELARDVMDGKTSEAEAMAELKRRVDDMVVTDFDTEKFGEGPTGQAPTEEELGGEGPEPVPVKPARAPEKPAAVLTPEDTNQSLLDKLKAGLTLFHGKGEKKGQTGAGSFGRGLYYTSSDAAAKIYGSVSSTTVALKNPLFLSDAEARRMAEEYGTRKGTPEQKLAAAQALTTDMVTKGHDGLVRVVRGPNGEIYEIEVVDFSPYLGKGKGQPAAEEPAAPKVAEGEGEFSLKQESFTAPKAPESTQASLFEPNKVEKAYPSGFDNRGIGTWPDQEAMKRDLRPLVHQGWVAEFGESKDGKVWAKLIERKAAGEGELKTGGITPPEFGKAEKENPQLSLDDELSGSLPLDKPEPLKSSEDLEVKEPGKEPEADEFDAWYKSQMEDYDKAIGATPEGQVKAFKLFITDDTGTDRFYGNFPEEARAELEAYAKKKGLGGKVKLGPAFNAKAENVDQSKELEVPKDLMDWMAESGETFNLREEAGKYEKEMFGDTTDNDPEKEVFAGVGIPKPVREKLARLAEKFDVEAMFNRLKAKATGLSVKLYHTRKNREFELAEGAVKDLKAIAKKTNGGKDLSPAEYQRIFILASKPNAFGALSDAEKARLGPIVRSVRAFFDNYIPRLRQAGVIEDPWPFSAIRRMRAELQDYRERVARGARNSDALKEKITERERAIKFLESTGMRYVHIPRYWLEAFFNARPEQAPKVLSQLFGQRETLDIEWLADKLLKDGMIQPTDLDVRRIMLMYSHSAGHKVALGQIIKDAKAEGLIMSAEDAPETWPRLAAQAFPSLKGYRMHPEMLEFMERNYLKPGWKPPKVGAVMGVIKMAQFWNPLNLSQYSLVQTMWTGAVTTLKMPKVFAKAVRDMSQKTPDYWEASYWGAFPDPFSPTFRQATARARTIINEDPILKKVLTKANPYHWSLMAAWKMENFFKMASYNYLREKGFSPKEAAQLSALAGGDYATLPPATRKTLNTVLFTPSFTIAMMKAQGEMVTAGAKIMAKPKLLFDKTGDAKYLRQMAKGAVFLTAGLVLKNTLMHKLGYKTDVWGLKWSKTVEDEEGNERELVIHMAAPDNVIIRYLNDLVIVGKAENKAKALWDRATWKLHPMWTTALEILSNKRMDGTPVWNPWDTVLEGRKKALVYATRRLIRIAELLPEQGQGNLSKLKAYKALREDLGQVGGFLMSVYSIPYMRSTADRRLMYEMNQMLDVFKQANKSTPPKNDAEAEERAKWLQDALEKVRKRIEEIQE